MIDGCNFVIATPWQVGQNNSISGAGGGLDGHVVVVVVVGFFDCGGGGRGVRWIVCAKLSLPVRRRFPFSRNH